MISQKLVPTDKDGDQGLNLTPQPLFSQSTPKAAEHLVFSFCYNKPDGEKNHTAENLRQGQISLASSGEKDFNQMHFS